MDPDDWAVANDLFHRALAEPPERRSAFVEASSAGNRRLCQEILSLLAAHEDAAGFIEQPAGAALLSQALDPRESLVGRVLGQYRVLRVLGKGGMGVVYVAEDTRLGRMVALKALPERFTDNDGRRERLRREARAAAALTHPGIATVYALEEFDNRLYIVGEYIPGETLRDELRHGPLPVNGVVGTALGVGRALVAAHDRGVVHRDLKPENIMRTTDGDVKILDFGLARFSDLAQPLATLTGDGHVLGTPAYMSPEQIRGHTIDFRSDLFSFGVLLHELASGTHPFAAPDAASTIARILTEDPAPLADRVPRAHEDRAGLATLDEVIKRCLRKAPEARYASTRDLVHALEQVRIGASGGTANTAARGAWTSAGVGLTTDRAPTSPIWWWQFHQVAASAFDCVLVAPLWLGHRSLPELPGLLLFLAGLVAVIVAVTLRLHQWFTVRSLPAEWVRQRGRTGRWIRLADWLLAGALLVTGALTLTTWPTLAVSLIGSAVAVLLASVVIEPVTTRAALGEEIGHG